MLFLLVTFLPAVMALLPFSREARLSESNAAEKVLDRVLSGIIALNLKHQKWMLGLIAFISLLGIYGITRIQVETNPMDFFQKNTTIARNFNDIYRDMAGSFPINVAINSRQDDYFESPEHLKLIAGLQQDFLSKLPGVDKTISFCDYLKLVNYATNEYQDELYALPEEGFEVRVLINSFKTMLGLDMLGRFMNENFSEANIVLRTHISSSKDFFKYPEEN